MNAIRLCMIRFSYCEVVLALKQNLSLKLNFFKDYRSQNLASFFSKPLKSRKSLFFHFLPKSLNLNFQMETIWLRNGSKKLISGDQISVGDLLACCELEQPLMAGFDVRLGRSVLTDYMERVRSDTNPHYDECHRIVHQMRDKFGGKIPGVNL